MSSPLRLSAIEHPLTKTVTDSVRLKTPSQYIRRAVCRHGTIQLEEQKAGRFPAACAEWEFSRDRDHAGRENPSTQERRV